MKIITQQGLVDSAAKIWAGTHAVTVGSYPGAYRSREIAPT